MIYKRVFIIVADSLGIGALDDAAQYDDLGANTFKHLSYAKDDFSIPTLAKLGVGNLTDINNTPPIERPLASYGRMKEISVGKDTLTGHWELMGLQVQRNFPVFTATGFPPDLMAKLEAESGYQFIGNCAASGTEIIKELGEEHMRTGKLIIYTSTDSVLQIAAHEEVTGLDELYRICGIARRITLNEPAWTVGRIIARPFVGADRTSFVRTPNRHDYALKPFEKTALDFLKAHGYDVIAVGKINDIFAGEGITRAIKTKSNAHGMEEIMKLAAETFTGVAFANLVDFDAVFGHRRNAIGYAQAVEEFDRALAALLPLIRDDDLLIICADHGNDPIHHGTDHTREYVPLLVYNPLAKGINLGTRETFADVGATISENFNVEMPVIGRSFLGKIHAAR
ncbi:MAG TPA: phosphopentomutase [Acholeplasmataceae bacterium]|jgi:phosphopentomutase|nr:phosphopentomutase [Acholeplasmataceae bacterium]